MKMAWRKNIMKIDLSEKRKKITEDSKCPVCNRKSALKYIDASTIEYGFKTYRKCRWCGHICDMD